MKKVLFVCSLAAVVFTACKKDEPAPAVTVVSGTKTISVSFDPAGVTPFTFFRFSDSSVVANSDSASTNWDFGMRFTNFIINSNASGPGNAGVILQDGAFDQITSAPTSGYAFDTTATNTAIGNYTNWATYNPQTYSFVPIAGKTFIFKTADGAHYAKMEMLSVNYGPFVGQTPTTLLYTFRYTYQGNGSTNF